MKRKSTLVTLGALLNLTLGSAPTAQGQDTPEAAVIGRISNADTRQFLNQAEVRVENTPLYALTDEAGYYRLSHVPAGHHNLVVTYVGLPEGKFAVDLVAGKTARQDFEFKLDIHVLGAYVVATEREGQAAAANQQRNAENMKTVVAYDAFGSLHDNNAAELLKSIPGFALEYSGEDAIGFTMRGQDSAYASVTTDGNPLASGANGSTNRGINFRNVTVNNIETIEINRAPTAAQPANSMGGSVNFVSKSAFSQKGRRLQFGIGANINTDTDPLKRGYQGANGYDHTAFPSAQLNYSEAFRQDTEHPIGVVFNATLGGRYLHNSNYIRSYTYVPALTGTTQVTPDTPLIVSSMSLREASAGWEQKSVGLNLDYKLTDHTTLFVRGSYQIGPQAYVYGFNNRLDITPGNQTAGTGAAMVPVNGNNASFIDSRPTVPAVGPGGTTGSRLAKVSGSEAMTNAWAQYSAGGKYRRGEISIDYDAYYNRAYDKRNPTGTPYSGALTYNILNVGFVMRNVLDPDQVTLEQTAGADFRNIANYGRLSWSTTSNLRLDRRWGGKVDAKVPMSKLPFPLLLQSGAAYDAQFKRNTTGDAKGGNILFGSGPDRAFGTADDVSLPMASFVSDGIHGWDLNGPTTKIDVGQWIEPAKVFAYAAANPSAMSRDLVNDVVQKYAEREFDEVIQAAYFMGTAKFGKLSVVPGLRWERTIDKGTGWNRSAQSVPIPAGTSFEQQAVLTERQFSRVKRKTTYADIYPNFQMNYRFTPNLIARTSYTETIGRPNFGSLLPGDTINTANATISRNNPDLEPFTAKNYDLSTEYYFANGTGNVMAAVFRKEISNYFSTAESILPGGAGNGYEGLYEGYAVSQSVNVPGMTLNKGYELSYQQSLRFLPGRLSNFVFASSYTHMTATPRAGQLLATNIKPDIVYAGLTYAGKKLRVDVKYNWRKAWAQSVNNTNGQITMHTDDGRWDFAIDYRFAARWQVNFNWRNVFAAGDDTYIFTNSVNFIKTGSLINVGFRLDL